MFHITHSLQRDLPEHGGHGVVDWTGSGGQSSQGDTGHTTATQDNRGALQGVNAGHYAHGQ